MGNIIGSGVEAAMKKQQDTMMETQRVMMERQIQMQNQMRERMMATQIARAREMFVWIGSFYSVAAVAMVAGFRRSGKPAAIAPLLPLTFVVGYQWDLSYGTKMNRILSEAENILMFEKDIIASPGGLPTIASLDVARQQLAEEAKYKGVSVVDSGT